jgi:hypothetical protein
MGYHKAPIKKSARIRKPIREDRFVTGADVLADAAMGDSRLRISRKRRNTGSR